MSGYTSWTAPLHNLLPKFAGLEIMFSTEVQLILSALFPIYIASHASLSRPKSAPKPPKSEKGDNYSAAEDDDEDIIRQVEGMSPSDAIIFPIMAGITLTGLYFLIKWLEDPAILSRILGWYFSFVGTFAVCSLIGDSLRNLVGFWFPNYYRSRGSMYCVKEETKQIARVNAEFDSQSHQNRTNPLTGYAGAISLPSAVRNALWSLRAFITQQWDLDVKLWRLGAFKLRFDAFNFIGSIAGVTAMLWANLVDCPWWLTNLQGTALCYGALQLMSPTTFATGSALLAGLFVYDIVMVFYTPMMVTVAKNLDVPIKLVFPLPGDPRDVSGKPRYSMLGLGDIVLPGLIVGMALRFDFYQHYLRLHQDSKSGVVRYVSPSKHWANRFWTSSWSLQPAKVQGLPDLGNFKKTYFNATMVGYVIGMICTLISMYLSKHPQPALLFLVPGVLGSLWLTAVHRAEVKDVWAYNEATDEDESAKNKTGEKVKDLDAKNNGSNGSAGDQSQQPETVAPSEPASSKDAETVKKENADKRQAGPNVFYFRIKAVQKASLSGPIKQD